ncbi:hypothetical protein GCM10007424_13060 [Flavobacterium suaedae]|uniref:Outer membrane protein beta-barrel domain-containing protein n=1 Tax=Flavobacterium suaedae TaxID=1767027 RepID=A0ABQ1JTZ2_9FLAO|nr:porin family protein [Flavobacterium suaedae]GGB74524.1 hypothetical protein GCM10007424_13060 [Flavobacterium suaedae]
MKKLLLSALFVTAFGVATQAQEIQFGVKAGVNIADLGGDADTEGSLTSFHVGGVAEFKLTETFSVQPELLYSMQGANVADGVDLELNYLNVPIMAKYYLMEGLSIEAGPQVGFLLSADQEGEDAKDTVKSVDFALNGGVAYDLPIGVFFQARYSAGLSDINDIEGVDEKATNNVISLSVGYKF